MILPFTKRDRTLVSNAAYNVERAGNAAVGIRNDVDRIADAAELAATMFGFLVLGVLVHLAWRQSRD